MNRAIERELVLFTNDHNTALQFYRQAVQLVPDIEQRIAGQEQGAQPNLLTLFDFLMTAHRVNREDEKKEEVEVINKTEGEELVGLFGQLSLQPCIPNYSTKVSV